MDKIRTGLERKKRAEFLRECAKGDAYVRAIVNLSSKIIDEKDLPFLFDILRSYDAAVKELNGNRIGDVSLCEREMPFWTYGYDLIRKSR